MKSQSREGVTYRVSYGCGKFTCECPYHVHGKGCRCQHIAAVEYMLLQNAESSAMKETIIDEMKLKCTECGSQEYVKNGHDTECKSGKKQRYKCKECRHRFRDNPGFEGRHTAAVFITLARMLNGMELSPVRIQLVLKHLTVDLHVDTVSRWLAHYATLVEKYTSPIQPPNLGSKMGADEKRQDVKGEEDCVMAMCIATRAILARETTADKMSYDATKLLEAAKAGKPYPILITDGLSIHHTAFKRVFGALKGFFIHISDIHIRNEFSDTSTQERVRHVRRSHQAGPGHKQRELAGLPHLPAGLQLHQAAQRNRRQDPGRGRRHQDTGTRQVADAGTERRRRGISARFHVIVCHSGRTLPHMYAKRRILGLDFAKNRSKTTPNGHHTAI